MRDFGAGAVVAVEGQGEVLEELRAIGRGVGADLVEDFDGKAAGVGFFFDHDGWDGADEDGFGDIRNNTIANRSQFFQNLALPFYGYNRTGAKVSKGIIDNFWFQGMTGGHKGLVDCVKAFSETDFTEDLKKIDIPVLVLHGEDDQIVPYKDAGVLSAKILPNATLKTYPGFPHGMCTTEADTINNALLTFLKS